MYKLKDIRQQEFENFYLPFEGSLNPKNRWVKLAEIIPWEEFEQKYAEKLAGTGMGSPAKSFRIALGALIIKEKLRITDEETVEQIRETPYLQYLIGMEGYQDKQPFDPSMMVHFRKRINDEMLNDINNRIHELVSKKKRIMKKRIREKCL